MPLTADDFIHENSGTGHTTGTSFMVSLAGADETAAGNTVLIFAAIGATPSASGFVLDKAAAGFAYVLRKSDVPTGETSWTVTFPNDGGLDVGYSWYAVECSSLDVVDPLDTSASTGLTAVPNGGTLSTGTTPQNVALDTIAFAVFGADQAAGTTRSWSGYTNSFDEVVDLTPPSSSGGGWALAVARRFPGSTGMFSSTGTLAATGATPNAAALIVAYRSAVSPIVAPLAMIAGFDWLTHGGIQSHNGATNMLSAAFGGAAGTFGVNYSIGSGFARNSAGGLRIVQSGAAALVRAGDMNVSSGSFGFDVRVVSATDSPVVAAVTSSVGSVFAQLLYDTSTSKLGVRCGTTGTVSWQSGTTALNTWAWVDLRLRTDTTTWRVEWRLETGTDTYTDQPYAELTGQSAGLVFHGLQFGYNAAQTMTADFDNVVMGRHWVAYPFGPHNVKLLTVDPAGTPSVVGTSSNFSVFTANGTLGAWNAVNARNAVDEVPPTVSASADGVVQTAAAAGDYMKFPMATYTCGPDETIVGVRLMAPMWGGTGSGTAQFGFHGWDGTTDTTLIAAGVSYDPGSPTAISATEPYWQCAMWQSVNGWTQDELDAAEIWCGYSPDATPDLGPDAIYLEVAIGPTRTQQLFGDLASLEADPNRGGAVSITVDAAAGQDADLYYEEGGSPTTVPVTGGTSHTEQINAVFAEDTNYISLQLPPEPAPVD